MKSKAYSRKERNRKYWRDRFEQLEEAQLEKSENYYHEIKYQYQKALYDIESDIFMWYQRFALNNESSITEVKKMLNVKELSELKWTVQEYIKYGEENALNQKWIKELENVSARAHITRLEALKLQVQQHIEILYNNEVNSIETTMKEIYKEGYYHTAFEVAKGVGVAVDLSKIDDNSVSKVIKKPWTSDGINFSERIWGKHRPQLIEELHKQLTQTIIRGRDPQHAIDAIAKKFDVSKRQAGNLIMTESAFFASQSKKDCFDDLDIEKFEVVATLDLKTSKICQELDGEVFDMDDYEVGVTSPPFHNYCRTTTAPYFEDEEEYGTRVSRDSSGNVYTVPRNMKYSEWYDKYVKGNPKEELASKKLKNKNSDKKQHREYLQVLKNIAPKSFDKFQDLKYNKIEDWKKLQQDFKIVDMYKTDFGYVSPHKIIELDSLAFNAKRNNQVSDYKKSGNFAALQYHDITKFASSRISTINDKAYTKYKGNKDELILLTETFKFKTAKYGDYVDGKFNEIDRANDTEAKFFEYLNNKLKSTKINEIYMISEKKMCESCRSVAKQFLEEHPSVKLNVISGKTLETWKGR